MSAYLELRLISSIRKCLSVDAKNQTNVLLHFQDWTIVTQLCLFHRNIYSRYFKLFKTQMNRSSLEYLDQNTPHHCSIPYTFYRFDTNHTQNFFYELCSIDRLQCNIPIQLTRVYTSARYLRLIIEYSLFPR